MMHPVLCSVIYHGAVVPWAVTLSDIISGFSKQLPESQSCHCKNRSGCCCDCPNAEMLPGSGSDWRMLTLTAAAGALFKWSPEHMHYFAILSYTTGFAGPFSNNMGRCMKERKTMAGKWKL